MYQFHNFFETIFETIFDILKLNKRIPLQFCFIIVRKDLIEIVINHRVHN